MISWTPRISAKYLPFIQARAEGKIIQYRYIDTNEQWVDCIIGPCFEEYNEFRIKPSPQLRPWKPEEVPFGKILRMKYESTDCRHFIHGIYNDNIQAGKEFSAGLYWVFKYCEWSNDNGKTWLPCGVMEES